MAVTGRAKPEIGFDGVVEFRMVMLAMDGPAEQKRQSW
jgi:hypothetical protein